MKDSKLISLGSITYASKARSLLLQYGIHSDIVKSPKIAGKSTCGYSLSVPYKFQNAIDILSSKGFKIQAIGESDML